jgi:rSAM/selenodomain-associated transferase 1
LFAKWPRPLEVKTRLGSETTATFAAAMAAAFLRDSIERLGSLEVDRVLVIWPAGEQANFAELAGERWRLEPQCDGDLGARLADFFARQFDRGAKRVVVVGTDSPTLPLEHVRRAFECLEAADVVIGPATDGGYYLIGSSRALPQLFADIRWSSPEVLRQTIARVESLALKVALLPPWYDVDTLADWRILRGHIAAMRSAGLDPLAPHTEKLAATSEF